MNDQPPRTLCCWPGLAGLWLQGHWSSLLVAVGFSLILNLALVSSFVWPAMMGPELRILIWPVVMAAWLIFGWISWRFLDQYEKVPETPGETDDTLFIQAQTEYLKGDLTQSELLLAQRLQIDSRDAEARLLLVAIYRRTKREEKALQQLANLRRLDTGIRWQFEIRRERQLIGRLTDDLLENKTLQDEDSPDSSHTGTIKLGEAVVRNDDETIHEDNKTRSINPETTNPKRAA